MCSKRCNTMTGQQSPLFPTALVCCRAKCRGSTMKLTHRVFGGAILLRWCWAVFCIVRMGCMTGRGHNNSTAAVQSSGNYRGIQGNAEWRPQPRISDILNYTLSETIRSSGKGCHRAERTRSLGSWHRQMDLVTLFEGM